MPAGILTQTQLEALANAQRELMGLIPIIADAMACGYKCPQKQQVEDLVQQINAWREHFGANAPASV